MPLNGVTSYSGAQDIILVNVKTSVFKFVPSSLT